MKIIGLCMIVKNEQHVILRCLESVRNFIDFVLVQDTGSSDQTVEIIETWLRDNNIPGEVYHENWRDFAFNRSKALAKLREFEQIDYAFIMDADDVLLTDDNFHANDFKSNAIADIYSFHLISHDLNYRRDLLCNNRKNFYFKGVLHEFLVSPPDSSRENIQGVSVISGREGSRSKDPNKYLNDANILKAELEIEDDPYLRSRYLFYVAQSLRDFGLHDEAITYYRQRADVGFWTDERFISLLEIARILIRRDAATDEILDVLDEAIGVAPHRAEAHYEASRLCRLRNEFSRGAEYAERGLSISIPSDGLFINDFTYKYGLLDELAVNSYWCREYTKCLESCLKLLSNPELPENQKPRILDNMRHAWRGLQNEATAKRKSNRWNVYVSARKSQTINICHVMINRHGGIFDDTIDALMFGLRDIGYQTDYTINSIKKDAVNIVLGSIAFAVNDQGHLNFVGDSPHIIYQQEQIDLDHGYLAKNIGYSNLLSRANVILEYSPAGLRVLESLGLRDKTHYLPPLFHPVLESYRACATASTDLLLYGSWTPRRQNIIDKLVSRGVGAKYVQGIYGDELKTAIAGSKIILNVHATEEIKNLETVRLSHLLANRAFVVSEASDHNPYGGGVVFCDYDDLEDSVVYYLGAGAQMRSQIADLGYEIFRRTDLVKSLENIFSQIDFDTLLA